MKNPTNNRRAFTLIELLTVIVIIGILAALLFPTIGGAMFRAKVSKAQTTVNGLASAFRAYYLEYGKWPTTTAGAMVVNTNLFNTTTNPKNISMFDFPTKDVSALGEFLSPLLDRNKKQIPFWCSFDTTYQNTIQNPFAGQPGEPANLPAGVLVWTVVTNGGKITKVKSW